MLKRDAFLRYSIFILNNISVMKSYLCVYFAIVGNTNRVGRYIIHFVRLSSFFATSIRLCYLN